MSRKSSVDSFGGADYRQGALERLREAQLLLSNENFAGSIYLAGRGVEGMLRAVIWERDVEIRRGRKPLGTGHDLRQLLVLVRRLGLLRTAGRDDEFEAAVHRVSRLWRNHLRFASTRMIETWWWDLGEVYKRRTIKQAAAEFLRSCSYVAKRCETL